MAVIHTGPTSVCLINYCGQHTYKYIILGVWSMAAVVTGCNNWPVGNEGPQHWILSLKRWIAEAINYAENVTWHDSSDKCVLLHQNKRRKHFQGASYSVVNSDNPHSSLHAVPPLMFLRYHCITDMYELSQLIFSQQHTGKDLLINTETISWVQQKKSIFSTLIRFLTCVVHCRWTHMWLNGEKGNTLLKWVWEAKISQATSVSSPVTSPEVMQEMGTIVMWWQQHKDTGVMLLLKCVPSDKFTWWIFNVPALSMIDGYPLGNAIVQLKWLGDSVLA